MLERFSTQLGFVKIVIKELHRHKVIWFALNLEVGEVAVDNSVTNAVSLSFFCNLEKVFLNQLPHFWGKEVYLVQIPSSAFTLLLKSETKSIFSSIDFFTLLWLIRIYHLEVLQVEMHIEISFDFQKPFTVRAEGTSILLSCGSYHRGILLIKHCSINRQIIEVSREALDLNHDRCSFIFVLMRQ